ncbi:MAG: hypothetical protein ACREKE_01800 [bacterium]
MEPRPATHPAPGETVFSGEGAVWGGQQRAGGCAVPGLVGGAGCFLGDSGSAAVPGSGNAVPSARRRAPLALAGELQQGLRL